METIKEIVKVKLEMLETENMPIDCIKSSISVAEFLQNEIGDDTQESLILLCLNQKNIVTHYSVVHRGTTSSSLVSQKDIFQRAILVNSAKIIIAHNHPSQNTTPSKEDDKITQRVIKAGKLLDIHLLDHIILSIRIITILRNNNMI